MIYITGDTHIPIDIHKLSMKNFPEQRQLSKDDFLIICGDFGGVWDFSREEKYWMNWLENKTFTIVFVDGNHENFMLLNGFPIEKKFGGKVHKIRDNVFHVLRGEVITLEGKLFFCMGGASSTDRHLRTDGTDWWPEEMPSKEEMNNAIQNLERCNWTVDYIISHCASNITQKKIKDWYKNDSLTSFFQYIEERCSYKHWFFGHYHIDKTIDEKRTAVYHNIIPLIEKGD